MNLVKYSVPTSSIIQTMKGSRFTQEELQCLISKGAPPEIIEQAKSQSDLYKSQNQDLIRQNVHWTILMILEQILQVVASKMKTEDWRKYAS